MNNMGSKRNYPEIRIKDAWLLRQNTSIHLHELWAKEGERLADDDEMEHIVSAYREAWTPYEKKIIHGMCGLLDLEFRQNIIDVNIAPWFYAFSDPMVIGVTYKPDRFVEVLTHELIHRLLTDNTQTAYDTLYANEWKRLFGADHTFGALVHIPVHAIMQGVFDDALDEPERTINDREACRKWEDYDVAWRYVEEHGYKWVVDQLRVNYKQLQKA